MKKIHILFLLSVTAISAFAQEINLTQEKIPTQGSFAQPFDVRFEISHTPGFEVELDTQSIPKDFELVAQDKQILSPDTVSYDLSFLPFTLGRSTFTAVNILLKNSSGQTVTQTASNQTAVDIQPVKLFDDQNMRDIRPPYIPTGWLGWLLCGIVLAVIIYLIRHFWKRKHPRAAMLPQEIPDNRPADVIALSKIQLLLQSGLWEKAEYKLFYIELSDILREYFWRRFRLDVSADTSAELLRRARREPQLSSSLSLLREYLKSADLVKFAKVIPSADTTKRDVQAVCTLVKNTMPVAVEITGKERK